jgi:hypothetical protein
MNEDFSSECVARLHEEARKSGTDLYSFLKSRFPDLSVDDRLKWLAAILNDHLESYRFNDDDTLRDGGYIIKRFYPEP